MPMRIDVRDMVVVNARVENAQNDDKEKTIVAWRLTRTLGQGRRAKNVNSRTPSSGPEDDHSDHAIRRRFSSGEWLGGELLSSSPSCSESSSSYTLFAMDVVLESVAEL